MNTQLLCPDPPRLLLKEGGRNSENSLALPEADSETDETPGQNCPLTNREQAEADRLIARHVGILHRFCRRAFRQREDVEDLESNVMLAVCRKWRSFNPKVASFPTWLGMLIRTEASAMRRKKEREPQCAPELTDTDDLAAAAAPEPIPAGESLFDRLDRLPEPYRRAFSLVTLRGHSCREAAAAMGATESTVRTYVWRARKRMRAEGEPVN